MRIILNLDGKYGNPVMRAKDRKAMRIFLLFWTLFLPVILFFQMSALFMQVPPKDIQYVEGTMFETNYYTKNKRYSGHIRKGLRPEISEKGQRGFIEFYLPFYAIDGDAEVLRDRINHPHSQKCRIGFVTGVEDKLTTDREKKYIISLECDGELLVKPETTVSAYREWAENRLLTAFAWLALHLLLSVFILGLVRIER